MHHPSPVPGQEGSSTPRKRAHQRPRTNSTRPLLHPTGPAACTARGSAANPSLCIPGEGHAPQDSGTRSQRSRWARGVFFQSSQGGREQERPSLRRPRCKPRAETAGCSVPWVCAGASRNLSWVCVGRCLQGRKVIGAGPGEWAIQMPRAQSLTSLSLNFISQETLAGSNTGESTRAICVLASPGVSRVMDPLERGKGWLLARTSLLWMKLCFQGGMAALQPGE